MEVEVRTQVCFTLNRYEAKQLMYLLGGLTPSEVHQAVKVTSLGATEGDITVVCNLYETLSDRLEEAAGEVDEDLVA